MKTQTRSSKLATLALNTILILTPFLLPAADQAGSPDRQVIAPNQAPPAMQSQYGYNPDPDELTLAHGKYNFVLGDVVFFDTDKTQYIAVPVGYLMDELKYKTQLFLVTQVKAETFLIKQINPELETVTTDEAVTKVDNSTARAL